MLARESAATMTPSLKIKARVVVPFAGFTICTASFWNPSNLKRKSKFTIQNTLCVLESKKEVEFRWLKLTSVVRGRSNDGTEENPSSISPFDPNPIIGIVVSSPLVSSFIVDNLIGSSENPSNSYKLTSLRYTRNQILIKELPFTIQIGSNSRLTTHKPLILHYNAKIGDLWHTLVTKSNEIDMRN